MNMIKNGFAQAKAITRRQAKTFYYASMVLPGRIRRAAYAVYAACRITDDAIDLPTEAPGPRLERIKKNITATYANAGLTDPLLLALRATVKKYNIPQAYFDSLIDGMRMDLTKDRYRDFAELYEYCWKVAGVVGLIMTEIFGYRDTKAKEYAVKLGIAMQLTNILRDIKEDSDRGRIYLAQNEMADFKVTDSDILEGKINQGIKSLIRYQIQRARQYYADSAGGIALITNLRCRLAALVMKETYGAILDEIEKNGYNVFLRRAALDKRQKLKMIIKILLEGKYL